MTKRSSPQLQVFMLQDNFDKNRAIAYPIQRFTPGRFRPVFPARDEQVHFFELRKSVGQDYTITLPKGTFKYKLAYGNASVCVVAVCNRATNEFNHSPSYVLAYTVDAAVEAMNNYILYVRAITNKMTDSFIPGF